MTVTTRIQEVLAQIEREQNQVVKERRDVNRGIMVALISQSHLVMGGPPGCGKTFATRSAMGHIVNGVYFEKDLHPASVPEDVFGPMDVKGYVEKGTFHTITTGRLAEATHAMLDEFFNCNLPVLQKLMPVLNERVFSNNGHHTKVPLRVVIAGTNKLLQEQELLAVWDRFDLRYMVDYITDPDTRLEMAMDTVGRLQTFGRGGTNTTTQQVTTISLADLDQAFAEAMTLPVPDEVLHAYRDLYEELKSQGIQVSDRRFGNSAGLFLANAYLNGHDEVQLSDLEILAHSWWTTPENWAKVQSVVLEAVHPTLKAILQAKKEMAALIEEWKQVENDDATRRNPIGTKLFKNLGRFQADVLKIGDDERGKELIDEAEKVKAEVFEKLFGIQMPEGATL